MTNFVIKEPSNRGDSIVAGLFRAKSVDKMWWKYNICLVVCAFAVANANFTYNGYKIYETIARNEEQQKVLVSLAEATEDIEFLNLVRLLNTPTRVMVSPKFQDDFEAALVKNELPFEIITSDLSKHLQQSKIQPRTKKGRFGLENYLRHDEVNSYLDELASKYSSYVKVSATATSGEGRQIKAVTISNGVQRADKKVVFLDAGIHAREWIAPATALYVINQLVENRDKNSDLLENLDWVVLPIVNPDGYEYTHSNDRMWRKTRKSNGGTCPGVDGNRNFEYHWGEVGSSGSQCSDIYRGPSAFSESETQFVRDILKSLDGKCVFYLTLHSYGKYLLYPWGWTSELPETWKDLEEVSRAGAKAIRDATGSKYTVGSSTNVLYAAAGGSDDYAFGETGVPISITMELPSGGMTGFDPPAKDIQKLVTESWIGIKAMAKKVEEKYVK